MTPPTVQGIPSTAAAGDTWRWHLGACALGTRLAAYPAADGWTASLALRGPSIVSAVPVDRAAGELVIVAETATANLLVGPYTVAVLVANAGATERYSLPAGVVSVTPNLATAAVLVSTNRARLALVDAALNGRVVGDVESYTILGRSITKTPVLELRRYRNELAWAVWREEHPGQLGPRRQVRFVG